MDLISRQALCEYALNQKDKSVTPNDIMRFPSAQTDLIEKMLNGIKVTVGDDVYSCGMRNGIRWCISLIDDKEPVYENCSPAQSEIIRCKDCKHRPKLDEEEGELDFPPTYRCPCYCDDCYYSWMPKDDWFCGNGERKS